MINELNYFEQIKILSSHQNVQRKDELSVNMNCNNFLMIKPFKPTSNQLVPNHSPRP